MMRCRQATWHIAQSVSALRPTHTHKRDKWYSMGETRRKIKIRSFRVRSRRAVHNV